MVKFGTEPFLECSSKGDKRFSAFYARVNGRSIEEIYQSGKIFEDGSCRQSIKTAKGRKAVNADEVRILYSGLWDLYFKEHPELLEVIQKYNGFSDIFGQENHACQAEEIYRVWCSLKLQSSTDSTMPLGSPRKLTDAFK